MTGSLTEPGVRLVSVKAQGSSCLGSPRSWGYRSMCSQVRLFMWVLGSELKSSYLYSKCSYPLGHLSSLQGSLLTVQWTWLPHGVSTSRRHQCEPRVYTTVSGVFYMAVCLLCSFRAVCNPEATLQFTFPLTWKIMFRLLAIKAVSVFGYP